MRTDSGKTPAKRVLILFPSGRIGQDLVARFAEAEYNVVVTQLEGKKFSTPAKNVTVVPVAPNDADFWEKLSPQLREEILNAPVVVYHAGKDFLRLKASGKNDEWQLDSQDESQKRFAFVEGLLSKLTTRPPVLWINLAVGVTGAHGGKEHYCRTRYGLLGFTQILHLNPAFRNMAIRNICLSYFQDRRRGHTSESCERCTTQELRAALSPLESQDDLLAYLVRESDAAVSHLVD